MSIQQHRSTPPTSTNGAEEALSAQLDALAASYGNRFLHEPAPDNALPTPAAAAELTPRSMRDGPTDGEVPAWARWTEAAAETLWTVGTRRR